MILEKNLTFSRKLSPMWRVTALIWGPFCYSRTDAVLSWLRVNISRYDLWLSTRWVRVVVWKLRFSWHAMRLLRVSPLLAWDMAGSWLVDVLNGDTTGCPKSCAEDERDAWESSV